MLKRVSDFLCKRGRKYSTGMLWLPHTASFSFRALARADLLGRMLSSLISMILSPSFSYVLFFPLVSDFLFMQTGNWSLSFDLRSCAFWKLIHVIGEQIKQLEEIFPEQNPSGAFGCGPGFPQLPREMWKGCLYSNTDKSLLAPEESPLGNDQIEGRDLYTFPCLTTKQSI